MQYLYMRLKVAPFAGAWIEIDHLHGRMRLHPVVAPFAGAWIEILPKEYIKEKVESLPSRERGLKFHAGLPLASVFQVAPFAGAWIEIRNCFYVNFVMVCRSLRGSVD